MQDLRFNILAIDKSLAAFQSVRANVAKTSAELRVLSGAGAGLRGIFGASGLLGLAALGGITAVGGALRDVVADAAKLVDVADKLGVTTTQLQELHFAADQTGVDIAGMNAALSFFARQVGIASTGTGDLYDLLKANNVALRDQQGHMRPLIELFRDYADLVKNAKSDTDRNVLATRGFGRANDDLINTLREGRKGLQDFADEAKRAGAILGDEDQLRRIADLDDRWAKFARTMETQVKSAILGVVDALGRIGVTEAQATAALPAALTGKLAGMKSALEDQKALLASLPGNTILQGEIKRQEAEIADLEGRLTVVKTEAAAIVAAGAAAAGGVGVSKGTTVIPRAPDPEQDRLAKAIKEVNADLDLQIANLGRSAREQAIYNELAKAGITIDTAAGKIIAEKAGRLFDLEAALKKDIEAMDALRDTAKDVLGGFISDLRAGKSEAEAFANVLNRIADKLIDMALNDAITSLFGQSGTTGAGSPFGAIIAGFKGLFGFADGGSFNVGGSGGTDSQLVAFRASPNERVDISRPGDRKSSAPQVIHIVPSQYFDVVVDGRVQKTAGPMIVNGMIAHEKHKSRSQALGH